MSGAFSAIGAFWTYVSTLLDPFCGPVGLFSLFGNGTLVACGDAGWGDEIAFGVKVTISLALATLPVGLLIGFLIALAAQSEEKSLRLATGIYTTIFRGLPELLTLFIVYYGIQMLLQSAAGYVGFTGPIEINAFVAGMVALSVVFSSASGSSAGSPSVRRRPTPTSEPWWRSRWCFRPMRLKCCSLPSRPYRRDNMRRVRRWGFRGAAQWCSSSFRNLSASPCPA